MTSKKAKPKDALDEDDVEDYGEKVGKWISQTLKTIANKEYWALLLLTHTIRRPILNVLHSLQKQ